MLTLHGKYTRALTFQNFIIITGMQGGASDLSRSAKNFSFELKQSVSTGAEGEQGEEDEGVGEGVGGSEELLIRPGPGRPRKKVGEHSMSLFLTLYGLGLF
jgi:hypothetical protein